ncbi:MAG: P-type conjugative transfer protein TrbJ [Caulobacteraceae bacterium]
MTARHLRAAVIIAAALALPLADAPPAAAQLAVIDGSNLAQNVLTAAHTLQQVNNQIVAIQNQVTMIQNMGKNLSNLNFSSLSAIANDLQQIGTLMNQAQGVAFSVNAVQASYSAQYPQSYGSGVVGLSQLLTDAQSRWRNAQNAYHQTMLMQSQITQTVQTDATKLNQLVTASQGAAGNLQVLQATNQLLALMIKQQIQLQTLLAAQGRAQAVTGAGAVQGEAESQAAFTTFLGSSTAYTPQ